MRSIPDEAVALIEAGDISLADVVELAAFTDRDTLQEVADIAFGSAAANVEGWIDGIDEPDPAIVAHRLHEAAHRFSVAAALHEALAIEQSDGERT